MNVRTKYHYKQIGGNKNLFFTDDDNSVRGTMVYQGDPLLSPGYSGYMDYTWELDSIVINTIVAKPEGQGIGALMIYLAAYKVIKAGRRRVELTHTAPTAYGFYLNLGFHKKRADVKEARTIRNLPKVINNPLNNRQDFAERLGARIYLWDGDAVMISRIAEHNIQNKWELSNFKYAQM